MKKKIAISLVLCVVGFGNHVYAKWSPVNGPYGANVTALAKAWNNIYAGTNGGGVFRSIDNGASWAVENDGLTDLHIAEIAIKDNNVFIGTKNGVYLSQDSGASWKEMDSGLNTTKSVNGLEFANDTLFSRVIVGHAISCYGGFPFFGVFFSIDNARTWHNNADVLFPQVTLDPLNVPDSSIYVNTYIKNGKSIIYGTTEGIYLSSDSGKTWKISNAGMSCTDLSLISYNAGKVFVCSKLNTFIVNSNGSSWIEKNNNLPHNGVTCLASVGAVMFAGTDSGVFAFTDTSTYWEPRNGIFPKSRILWMFSYGKKIFTEASIDSYPWVRAYVSNTLGKSWDRITDSSDCPIVPFLAKGNLLYGNGCGGYCFISSDTGLSWLKTNIVAPTAISTAVCNNYLFELFPRVPFMSETCPGWIPANIFILKPSDTSWTGLDTLTNKTIQNLASLNGNLFAATGDGVYLAPDSGRPWTDINEGLGNRNVRALAFSDREMFAATEAGLWHRPLSELPLGTIQKVRAPFNPVEVGMSNTKNFKYSLPHESFVSLRIYDLAGRLVCSFINKKQAAGSYSIVLPVGNLRSGNYLYSFTAGEYHVQKKIIILK